MTDLEQPNEVWSEFVAAACKALGVDQQDVDITAIHDLARDVAHNVDRPLAPVSTFILGMAIGRREARGESTSAAERDEMIARIPLS